MIIEFIYNERGLIIKKYCEDNSKEKKGVKQGITCIEWQSFGQLKGE